MYEENKMKRYIVTHYLVSLCSKHELCYGTSLVQQCPKSINIKVKENEPSSKLPNMAVGKDVPIN